MVASCDGAHAACGAACGALRGSPADVCFSALRDTCSLTRGFKPLRCQLLRIMPYATLQSQIMEAIANAVGTSVT